MYAAERRTVAFSTSASACHIHQFQCPLAVQALQAVSDLANDPQLHLEWDLEPGDMQVRIF